MTSQYLRCILEEKQETKAETFFFLWIPNCLFQEAITPAETHLELSSWGSDSPNIQIEASGQCAWNEILVMDIIFGNVCMSFTKRQRIIRIQQYRWKALEQTKHLRLLLKSFDSQLWSSTQIAFMCHKMNRSYSFIDCPGVRIPTNVHKMHRKSDIKHQRYTKCSNITQYHIEI